MNIKIVLSLLIICALIVLTVMGIYKQKNNDEENFRSVQNYQTSDQAQKETVIVADKIEVVNFFGTQRCAACITLGRYTKKTIEQRFEDEIGEGKIVFLEVNGQLSENQDMVIKYQARGSSLYINAIKDNQDNISEEVTVWRLINNEDRFASHLEGKLNSLLGK